MSTINSMVDTMASDTSAKRRNYSEALKAQVMAECEAPSTSAAKVAVLKRLKFAANALTCFIDDGDMPADNNWVENKIRPIAVARSNWLFADSLRAGQRTAAFMSLLHSAKLNGHEPYA